jgi:hypothetical protein
MTLPHCDSRTLHPPGVCDFCDDRKDLQEIRQNLGIPFSGEGGSPDEEFRDRETIDRWPGNRPAQVGHSEGAHFQPSDNSSWGTVEETSPIGLTPTEIEVCLLLADAWNKYLGTVPEREDGLINPLDDIRADQMMAYINSAEQLVMSAAARRAHPDIFHT